MSVTPFDAAQFVKERLQGHDLPISQEEMRTLVEDLKATLGRALTAVDVAEVVAAFNELKGGSSQLSGQPG